MLSRHDTLTKDGDEVVMEENRDLSDVTVTVCLARTSDPHIEYPFSERGLL
jgi:hypothetical protein